MVLHISVNDILSWANDDFGDGLAMTTAFGYSGIVLLSFVKETIPDLPIYFIDTGKHFKETITFMEKLKKEWNLNIIVISSNCPNDITENNHDVCCSCRKVRPLFRVLKTKDAWLSAIRKDQTINRSKIEMLEFDIRGIIKINPLYNWSKDDVWKYIHKLDLPYNPLYDRGYLSIGCEPCTSIVDEGSNERDGRWRCIDKEECGIHINE